MIVKEFKIYEILNSAGEKAIEIELNSINNISAIASSPSAIKAGKREVKTTCYNEVNKNIVDLVKKIINKDINQLEIDKMLELYFEKVGSDVCLSTSLAFARLNAKESNISLVKYIANEMKYQTKYISPIPIVTIFSGGVHNVKEKGLQNIMIVVNEHPFTEAEKIVLQVYEKIEKKLINNKLLNGYGASSGMIAESLTTIKKFDLITSTIRDLNYQDKISLAVDVAAEHFYNNGKYDYEGKGLSGTELEKILFSYIDNYNLMFIEDPFDIDDGEMWKQFKEKRQNIYVVGDDLFSTQSKYLNKDLANGIIIKMNQAGTLSNTLETIKKAKELGMVQCVSHRSHETEDTFMCDLAVATDSEYIKIGGPRRGDRIVKYNQLKRLEKCHHPKF